MISDVFPPPTPSTQQFNNFTNKSSSTHPWSLPHITTLQSTSTLQQPAPQNKVLTFQPHEQQPPFPSGPTLICFRAN
ncbi:hypothetical protein ACN38_g7505 [Penicillium nordicum]|uniref:Uncharacterized protein n=1 Tax=Penicillium nordicum TaxID=229535 RepID=A0A0M8P6V7_9EURO|nr:hypothetical protein ACN38_g7505 [Penicillium nordicum]